MRAAEAIPYLAPASDDVDPRYRMLVDAAIAGDEAFERKRETIDEYGWRNFGDTYADHENPFSGEAEPIVSHYNNQYDAVNGFAAQFMRTGDARWWRLMTELAVHVTDIDIYHTDRDKSAFSNGLLLAHLPLRRRRQVQPPVVSAPRRRLWRRTGQRAQLRRRPADALAA